MKSATDMLGDLPQRNPFSTGATRPGARTFRFPSGVAPEQLVHQLRQQSWWGEILGPHGSGKSTLVTTLEPLLREAGRDVRYFTLHQGEKRLSISHHVRTTWAASTQVVVDGYEQLSLWQRAMLKRICKRQHAGLLVTTHESIALPTLYRTSISLELAQQLVGELTGGDASLITSDDVRQSFHRQQANLREVFFELYDVYESRRPG
ncbi:MAG: hypothetical protein ACC628_08795 [Pirellulaceae bacterium]